MRLTIIATGSNGNCYALEHENRILILDCGIPHKHILKGINYRISSVDAVLITHEHKDHSYSEEYFRDSGIPIVSPNHFKDFFCNTFKVKSFPMIHDVPCYGYLISTSAGSLIYITDTSYSRYIFPGVNNILMGCNHDRRLLDVESQNFQHICQGHMELQTAKRFISKNNTDSLHNVILCHTSLVNLDSEVAMNEISEIIPIKNVYLASKGLEIEL